MLMLPITTKMARFSDLGINTDVVVGRRIEIECLFDKRILVEAVIIKPTKYPGKNTSGMRMQMQVCFPEWKEDGTYNVDDSGKPVGDRRSCFTGSDILIEQIEVAKTRTDNLFPLETTIIKSGKCFQFT